MAETLQRPPHRPVAALLLACHPGPAAAVTALAGLLAVAAGAPASVTALVVAAFAAGQLSVGWSNDWWDADRDRQVARLDKPVAAGRVSRRSVGWAAAAAVVAVVPLSLALGLAAGAVHLVAVASAWSYNLWLKRTALSWLPFAVSFGLLPVVVTLAVRPSHVAPWWAVTAGALLGVGAHLVNVLPDVDDDVATGVRGLVHRLPRRATAVAAPAILTLATLVVVVGPPGPTTGPRWAALAVAVAAAGAAAVAAAKDHRRHVSLAATVLVAAVNVALLVASGSAL
ncbi:MAG: UbiA family prenyltransferase [Angustibacter sp.]